MGVGEWFSDLYSNLKIGQEKRQSFGYRTGRMTKVLNEDFRSSSSDTANRFYVGSMGRNTAIPTVSDVDLLYVLTSETLGFPSRIEDDPVLQLAMPGGDAFEDAEERRLFYVALTRAKVSVTLITLTHKESPFIAELVKDYGIQVVDVDGEVEASRVCPDCGEGFLIQKSGPYGAFLSCSRFPTCCHKEKIQTGEPNKQAGRRRAGSAQSAAGRPF